MLVAQVTKSRCHLWCQGILKAMGGGASDLQGKLKDSSAEELKRTFEDLSIENRQWIVAAIEQVEAARSMDLSAVAGAYTAHASDGDWGSYTISVRIDPDGNGKIYESNCDFRDSPATKTERNGTFSIVGDVVTFNAPQRTITTEGAGGTFTETKEEVERLRFRVKANQLLQLKGDTDEVGTISGGIAGDPQPAVLNKSS
ncbi:unnamed protein product [Durusdinium trenchii]|uniref:Uncharacterized protein n=3 Tax=Durusdinium trenchii TaxID=1381693 RepID=A0ABP0I2T5_9DINO